jgi:Spy/CpxP family protein refolding chaperone
MLMLSPSVVQSQMMKMPEEGMGGGEMGMHEKMGMHEMGMDGGMMSLRQMMMASERLDLTAEQRKNVRALHLQHRKEAIPVLGKIRMAELEIEEALLADPVNLEKVKAQTKEKHEAAADLEIAHHQLHQQIKALLTPEQRQRLDEMMMRMGRGMGHGMDSMKGSEYEKPMGRSPHKSSPGKPAPKTDNPHGR